MGSWTNATPTSTTAGVLRPDHLAPVVDLDRVPGSAGLDRWVEWYWTVRWDLPAGERHTSEVLPHPTMHLTVESGDGPRHGFGMPTTLVHGVITSRFTMGLANSGRVFGVKFRPGGLGAFTGHDAATFVDRVVPASAILDVGAVQDDVLDCERDGERAAVMDGFLCARRPEPDPAHDLVLTVIADMLADHALVRVEDLTARHAVSTRTLQRLFRRYVGVGPKWVLRRYRLHDAVTLIDQGHGDDLAALATGLGWFDQSHFTRDFTALVGQSPSRYAARATSAPSRG
jgi:AraC-like DNA-binding protein